MSKRTPRRGRATRDYPRTARLNELLREILADTLEIIDDDRLGFLTITAVVVDPDLRHAIVYYDSWEGEGSDEQVLEALDELRPKLKRAIGSQARIKRVPDLAFRPDLSVRAGQRIDEILRDIEPPAIDGDP